MEFIYSKIYLLKVNNRNTRIKYEYAQSMFKYVFTIPCTSMSYAKFAKLLGNM